MKILPGRKRERAARRVGTGGGAVLVQLAIEGRIAEDGLDVFPGLRKGNALDKLSRLLKLAFTEPFFHAERPGIIRGQGVFHTASEAVQHFAQVAGSIDEVDV